MPRSTLPNFEELLSRDVQGEYVGPIWFDELTANKVG